MATIVLLTGFEPFNQEAVNPSWEAVKLLAGWGGDGFAVVARQLPCVFGLAGRVLRNAIDELDPELVIAVGQAGGGAELLVERIAINVADAPFPDNHGQQPIDARVIEGAPVAYFSSLPHNAIVDAMRERGVAAAISHTAGTFVCNHVFFGLMHYAEGAGLRAGFVHLPFLPEQAEAAPGVPSMTLEQMVLGLRIAIEVSFAADRMTYTV